MLAPTMGDLSTIQVREDAAVAIIVVHGLNYQRLTRWDSNSHIEWCRDRLPAQHDQAHIMAYVYDDLNIQDSLIGGVDIAARNLLSKIGVPKPARSDPTRGEDRRVLDRALPVLFVCWGFAGLVVKKALVLARSQSAPHSMSLSAAGIIFLDTPHSDGLQVWVDTLNTREVKNPSSRDWTTIQTRNEAEDFVDLIKDFQKISSSYIITYICNEDWSECSEAIVLHSSCLWSMVSQEYLRRTCKENHFILPGSITAVLTLSYVERATVGMRKLVASRESYHKCLESQLATKSMYAGQRLPSTGDWVFTSDKYLDWIAGDGPACLWMSGVPGAGKTILTSAIVDDLLGRQLEEDVIAYFFFEEGFTKDDFAQKILETIFCQLLDRHALPNFMLYKLLPEIEAVDSPMSRETFQRLLRRILNNLICQSRIVLILDGVDEDEWIKWVVMDEVIRTNISRHRSVLIRCLISSRDGCDYKLHKGRFRKISLDNELGVQRDVLRFAESRIANIYHVTANQNMDLASLGRTISTQGRGNFLWVALVTESLQDVKSIAEVEDEIHSLPPTIDGLYQLALKNIPTQDVETSQRLLAFLIAGHRPLRLCELAEALAIENDPHRSPGLGIVASSVWSAQTSEAEVRRLCRPLIMTTREGFVNFRHQSVRDYLLSAGETSMWRTSMVEAHILVARTCLILLSRKEDQIMPLGGFRGHHLRTQKRERESSMKSYASANWSFHYGSAESRSKTLPGVLHHWLTLALSHDCEELSLPKSSRLTQIQTTILRIAAYHGFASLTRICLEMGVSQNGSCSSCETPLALAAARCHPGAAALLIKRGAFKTSMMPSRGETALYLAAAYGSQEIAEMLLKESVNAGANTGSSAENLSRTPLHAAACSGHVEILKLLMDHGADVEVNIVIPTSGETPLHLAASHGHLHTVKWLVEGLDASNNELIIYDSIVQQRYYQAWTEGLLTSSAPTQNFFWETKAKDYAEASLSELQSLSGRYADINARTREGRTPLHLAASNGHVSTMQFLLQKGASINPTDNYRFTALMLAAENGHLSAVKLLLTAGADLNEDLNQFGATLKSTLANGHDTVANLLMWHFFSVKVMGRACQLPVLDLATKSKRNTVRDAIRKKNPRDRFTA